MFSQAGWLERGIHYIEIDTIPLPADIDEASFSKVPLEQMRNGIAMIQEMRGTIEREVGASGDYWRAMDRLRGLGHRFGYEGAWEAFYGSDVVRVEKDGDRYNVVSGRHRIWLAKKMGVKWLPISLVERGSGQSHYNNGSKGDERMRIRTHHRSQMA